MRKLLTIIAITAVAFLLLFTVAHAAVFQTIQGGTGTSSPSGLLKGNGTSPIRTAIAGTDYVLPSSLSSYLTLADWYATTTDALDEGVANLFWTPARDIRFSTTSASYFTSVGLSFATTSADAWFDTKSVSGFSTTSANYYMHASPTVPTLYANQTWTGTNALSNAVTISPSLSDTTFLTVTGVYTGTGGNISNAINFSPTLITPAGIHTLIRMSPAVRPTADVSAVQAVFNNFQANNSTSSIATFTGNLMGYTQAATFAGTTTALRTLQINTPTVSGGNLVNNYGITFNTSGAATNTAAIAIGALTSTGNNVGISTGATNVIPTGSWDTYFNAIYPAGFIATTSAITGDKLVLKSTRSAIVAGNLVGGLAFMSDDSNLTMPGLKVVSLQAVSTASHTASVLDTDLVFNLAAGSTFAERMRITGAGRVGLGTTTPLSLLSIFKPYGSTATTLFSIASSTESVGATNTSFLSVSASGFGTTTLSGLTVSGSATSTSNVGFNITTGCFAISGSCIGGSGGSGTVTNIATTYPILGGPITTTGTLSLAFGTTTANAWNALQNFSNASTSMLTATSSVWLTALGTPAGTLLAVDPTGKIIATSTPAIGVTAVSGTYPVTSSGGTTPAIGLAFGTTTANTWSALQTYSNASSTLFTAGTVWFTGITSAVHLGDANGRVGAATTQTCTNQFVRAMSAAYVATCSSVDISSDTNLAVTAPITLTGDTLSLGNVKQYPAFRYATSTAWTGTTTIALGPSYVAETWNGVQCFTNTGTVSVVFHDGSNRMNLLSASTTVGTFALTTNNTFTAAEKRYVEIGTPASSPTEISCTVSKTFSIN